MILLSLVGSDHVTHLLQTPETPHFSLSKQQTSLQWSGRLCATCPLLPIKSHFISSLPPLWHWHTSGLLLTRSPCPNIHRASSPPLGLLTHLCSSQWGSHVKFYVLPYHFHHFQVNFPISVLFLFLIFTRGHVFIGFRVIRREILPSACWWQSSHACL